MVCKTSSLVERSAAFADSEPAASGDGQLAMADPAANDRVKMVLMTRLRAMRQSRGMTQIQAARWFGVSQPRISHLAQNRLERFSSDSLINMLEHAGIRLSLSFEPRGPADRDEGGLAVAPVAVEGLR